MANETVIHTSLFVRGAQDPNIAAQRFAVFTGTGATDTNLLGYRTASGIVSDLGLPEVIDDQVANLLSGGTNISLTYNDVANKLVINSTGSLAGSGTANQVAFWNATGVTGENDLWWNPTNNFLGVGTNSPSNSLHIESSGNTISYLKTTSSTSSSAVQLANSSNNITSLQNYSGSATGTTVGLSNASLSVLNSTDNLVINAGSGSNIVSGIGGSQMVKVTSSGVVIGTGTSAARTLQVDGDFRLGSISGIMTNQILGRNSNNGDVGAMILGEGLALSMYTLSVTGTTFGTGTTNQIAYWATSSSITGENDLWWNPTNNFLGIGTNSPSNHLQINATSPSISLASSASSGTSSIALRNDTNNFSQIITYGSSNPSTLYSLNLSDSTNIITSNNIFLTPTGGSLLVGNGVSEFFRATSSGVGIGGVIPTRTLHVAGTMRLTGSTATIPTNILGRDGNGDISNLAIGTGLNLSSGTLSLSGATGTGVTNQVAFWGNTTTLSGKTTLWWNPSTDRLGVGTGAPAQTLDIAGTMRLTGSTGTSTTIMGRNSSGDVSAIVVDGGLSLSGNVLSATGVTYGTGTTNYLTKWASSSGLTDSIVLETGGTVDINGSLRVVNSSGTATTITGQDANGYVSRVSVGTGLSLSGNTIRTSGVTFGSGSANQIAYWANASSVTGENDLWWDSSNNFLGVGTNSPSFNIDVLANRSILSLKSTGTTQITGGYFVNNDGSTSLESLVYGSAFVSSLYGVNLGSKAIIRSGSDLFISANGSIFVGNSSTEFFRATSTGVGIGGVTPARTLHVAGTMRLTGSTGTPFFILGRDSNGDISNVGLGAGLNLSSGTLAVSGATGTGVTNQVAFWANTTTLSGETALWWNPSTDRLGIGTSDPQQTLDVRGTMRLTGSTGTPDRILGRNSSGDVANLTIGSGLQIVGGQLSATGGASGTTSGTGSTNQVAFWTGTNALSGENNLWWDSSLDRLGVNTNNPQRTLHIEGDMRLTGSTGTPTFVMGRDNNGDIANLTLGSGLQLVGGQLSATGGSSGTTSGSGSTSQVAFWTGTNSLSGENELWWDFSTNRLGVGINTPSQTLDVQGTMRLTGSTGTSTTVMGRDASGDISAISIGDGLSLSGNVLSTTGITAGTLTGTGTTDYLSKWASASGLTDSIVLETGSTIDINGALRVRTSSGTSTTIAGQDNDGYFSNITVGNGLSLSGNVLSTTGVTAGTVTGTGTTNYLSKWASASGLTDSIVLETGGTIDIAGALRVTVSSGTSTTIAGQDNNGYFSNITVGNGLSLSGNILTTTGITAGTVTGTGTTNYLSKWASASGLTDSIVFSSGSNVGINTNAPQQTLDVRGTMRLTGSTGTPTNIMGRDGSGDISNVTIGTGLQLVSGTLSATGGASGTTTGSGATSQVAFWVGANALSGENNLWWDSSADKLGVGTSTPQRTLHVEGDMRLTGSTGTSTTVMGRDAIGDVSAITVGSGLSLSGNILTTTGITAGTVTGTGTTNYLSKWASASGLTDSIVLETGSTIDINGSLRVRTSSGTATSVMGRDVDGYVSNIAIGDGLSVSGGTLSFTGSTGGSGTLTGTGTTNYIPKWASASGLTDSIVFSSGSNVGIGTSSPQAPLHILTSSGYATLRLQTTDPFSPASYELGVFDNTLTIGNTVYVRFPRFGVATSTPQQTLDVAGTMRLSGSAGTPTFVMGRDNNGDIANLTLGSGLQIVGGTLSATGGASGTTSGTGSTNQVAYWVGSNALSGENNLWWDSSSDRLGIGTNAPAQTLDVAGTMRLTGSTGTGTTLMGRDGSGDVSAITVGSGLSLSGNTITATGTSGGGLSGSGTATQVAFWNGATGTTSTALTSSTGLTWDNVNGRLGINNSNVLAPIHVGNENINNSSDAQILISRSVNDTKSGNAHAFSDSSNINRNGTIGYNSFDARINFSGTYNYDHYAAFQAAPTYNFSGNILDNFGLYNTVVITNGQLSNNYALYAANPSGNGTLTNNYGVFISNLSKGTNNFGFYSNMSGSSKYNIYVNGDSPNYINGFLGIGSLFASNVNLKVSKNIGGSTISYGIRQDGTVQSSVTNASAGYLNQLNTQAASFTLNDYRHFYASQGIIGSSSNIINQIGYYVDNSFTSASNNYAFYSDIPFGNNRWNLYMNGTANNYLAGNTVIGTTTPSARLHIRGSGTTTGTTFLTQASGGTNTFAVLDNGNVGINNASPAARLYVKGATNGNASTVFEVTDNTDRDIINVRDDGRISLGRDLSVTQQSSVTIQAAGTETNIGIAIVPKGNGAITASIPDGGVAGGNARGNRAVDLQMQRDNAILVASGSFSGILSGYGNRATASYSVVLGGQENNAGGQYASIIGGVTNEATGARSTILGGITNTATAELSTAAGGYSRAYLYGQNSYQSGGFSTSRSGDAQTSNIRVRVLATGTSAQELTLDGATPVASNRIIPALLTGAVNGRLWNARVQLSAIVTVSGTSSGVAVGDSWVSEHIVGIKRIGSTTSLVGTGAMQNLISNDTSMSSAVVTISADDTNESLKIEFTPPTTAVATTVIRVVATVYLTEVGF